MTRRAQARVARGWFAIGIYRPKTEANVGVLMRAAYLYQASAVFTIERRYHRHASDTPNVQLSIPFLHFEHIEGMKSAIAPDVPLIGVEQAGGATPLPKFWHPHRAVYLLGAEDVGLPVEVLRQCDSLIEIPSPVPYSMNVGAAGSIVLYDRYTKGQR